MANVEDAKKRALRGSLSFLGASSLPFVTYELLKLGGADGMWLSIGGEFGA